MVFVTHRTWINRIRPQHRRIRAQREEIDSLATESFGGMRVVRGFSRQRSETDRLMRGNHLMGRQQLYAWWWARIVEIVWETLIPLASSILMLYGGWQVLQGDLTLGELMMFLVYLMMLLGPLATLAESATSFKAVCPARSCRPSEEPREMEPDENSIRLSAADVEGRVTFENVSFSYPSADTFAIEEVSLDVAPGETIAFVGPSGAGKTTICNLVARFYDPTSGRVLLDGRDLREFDVETYRSLIASSRTCFCSMAHSANIGYGRRHATSEEISRRG
ncbi:MAG: ABC transporter ATP-binding protein [Planctomycetaceae bacterium]